MLVGVFYVRVSKTLRRRRPTHTSYISLSMNVGLRSSEAIPPVSWDRCNESSLSASAISNTIIELNNADNNPAVKSCSESILDSVGGIWLQSQSRESLGDLASVRQSRTTD